MSIAKPEDASPPFRFIALVAMMTALMAMSIDTMLPAQGAMVHELGADPANEPLIMMLFFAGNMFGIPVFGPMSDSMGRKPSIFAGLVFYIIGALLCYASWSFPVLLIGRFIQGFGAASPRIVAIAMVRDGAKGAAMAKTMSFVMSVFMLVPIFAPSIGQFVLLFSSWHYIFLGLSVMALIVGLWLGLGQKETLHPEFRLSLTPGHYWHAVTEVVNNKIAFGYTLATGMVFGVFTTYLSVCRRIYVDQYGMGNWFPIIFGSLAICIAVAMIVNGSLVQRLGMRKLSRIAMVGYSSVWAVILVLSLIYVGQPPLFLLMPLFGLWFFTAGFTFGNFNAMAMEPMGHIAGMAAAVSGVLSQAMGIGLGIIAARSYDGTLTMLSAYFVVYTLIAYAITEWAESSRTAPEKSLA